MSPQPTFSPTKKHTTSPSNNPTKVPTRPPSDNVATYVPGYLTVPCEKLVLSTGMTCKRLTESDTNVRLADSSLSADNIHRKAGGAGVVRLIMMTLHSIWQLAQVSLTSYPPHRFLMPLMGDGITLVTVKLAMVELDLCSSMLLEHWLDMRGVWQALPAIVVEGGKSFDW